MKKLPLIHPGLSEVIASMGVGDRLVIANAMLAIPPEIRRIDLALTKGIPSLEDTLRVILTEMCVEEAVVAEEMIEDHPHIFEAVQELLGEVAIKSVLHVALKQQTKLAQCIIRTGEYAPYANIILFSGEWDPES
ncbi:MAG: D-ribose pyranase [Anaerolineales bacterium]|nr:D-ribose pyranase [Anaerolineales bacterium]